MKNCAVVHVLFGILAVSALSHAISATCITQHHTVGPKCPEQDTGTTNTYNLCQEPGSPERNYAYVYLMERQLNHKNCSSPNRLAYLAYNINLTVNSTSSLSSSGCSFHLEAPALMVIEILLWQSDDIFELVLSGGILTIRYTDLYLKRKTNYLRSSRVYFYTVTKSNVLLVKGVPASNVSLPSYVHVEFRAVPPCHHNDDLQAFCFSENEGFAGYIQTFNWNDEVKYRNNVASCLTMILPTNYTVMLSAVRAELESNNCKYDKLELYNGTNCRGSVKKKICTTDDLEPTVYPQFTAVSFLFSTDYGIGASGFRILYSFHNAAAIPQKLDNEKWNCSGVWGTDFKKHFLCGNQPLCDDFTWPMENHTALDFADLCGFSGSAFFEFNEHLYYRLPVSVHYTWDHAEKTCETYGAHLIDTNIFAEAGAFHNMTRGLNNTVVFVGLRLTSSPLNEMYQYTWMWSNQTLAVDLDINFSDETVQHCVGITVSSLNYTLSDIACSEMKGPRLATFICEKDWSNKTTGNAPVLLSSPATDNLTSNLTMCHKKHIAHTFLACDADTNCSTCTSKSSEHCASRNKSWPDIAPFFTCRNSAQFIPYSLVCDHRFDCWDKSDENFCTFPSCQTEEFSCADNKQCIPKKQHGDRVSNCVDGSDETQRIKADIKKEDVRVNTIRPPAVVDFTGNGTFEVTSLTSLTNLTNLTLPCPESHFQCPGGGYCMPVYVRCNGVNDCPGKEDEAHCESYTCAGFYRCRKSRICLHRKHLCDGIFQCPERDDELACGVVCPPGCTCYGHAFICTKRVSNISQYSNLRYLEVRNTPMAVKDVAENNLLVYLGLQSCGISNITDVDLPNLQYLDLSQNRLFYVSVVELSKFGNLRYLNLSFNPLVSAFFSHPKLVLPGVEYVNFADVNIMEIDESFLQTFPNVRSLNLSGCGVERVSESAFRNLTLLSTLDLKGCSVKTFHPDIFQGLLELTKIHADNYKLCCPPVLPEDLSKLNCFAPTDEVSSCNDLLRTDMFRLCLAFYAHLSILGNLGSFVYRLFVAKLPLEIGYDIFVVHLSVADFLMGVYLAIIGVADRVYMGTYLWNDEAWKHSVACKTAGFLSLLSSEVSAFLICIITVERVLVIAFPFNNLRFRRRSANVTCLFLWLAGVLLAGVPLLPQTRHWEFYSQSGICIPLPITRKEYPGRDFAFVVMIVVNFVLFILIAVGQFLIYWSMKSNSVSTQDSTRKSQDTAVARRLLAIAMTDFLCWFPIGLLGVLARVGVPIPGEVNVAMAIFVLPLNSALNPFLYTFNMLMDKRRAGRLLAKKPTSTRPARKSARSAEAAGSADTTFTNAATDTEAADSADTTFTNAATDTEAADSADTTFTLAATDAENTVDPEDVAWKQFETWLTNGSLPLERVRHRVKSMADVRY